MSPIRPPCYSAAVNRIFSFRRWPSRKCLGALSALLFWASLCSGADTLRLSNGDVLRGTIKRLDKSIIVFATEYSDSDFQIKWEKVKSIESSRHFLVETFDGDRLTGDLKETPEPNKVGIGEERVELSHTALLRPYEESIASRVTWGFDLGFNATRANSVKQLSLGSNVAYTGERTSIRVHSQGLFNSQSNAPRTRRWEIAPEYRYLVGRAWYALGTANLFSSEQQQVSLRSMFGGGVGRYFFRSTIRHLAVGGGAAWTRERYFDRRLPVQHSADAFFSVEYLTKRLKVADVVAMVNLFPSMTEPGRYRSNLNTDVTFNLKGDWYCKTGFYTNFDSAPPGSLPRTDYGWRNAFGYKF